MEKGVLWMQQCI